MTNSPDNAQPAPRPVTTAEHDVLMAAARDGMTLVSKGRLVATPTAQAAPAAGAVAGPTDATRNAWQQGYAQGVASALPSKVTPDMRRVFREGYREGGFWSDRLDYALEKMLAAAPTPAAKADSQPAAVVGRLSPSKEWLETRLAIADDCDVQAGLPAKKVRPCDTPPGCNSHNCMECNDFIKPAPVRDDLPTGAIINGRALAERLENGYNFECEAGSLRMCSDWQEFVRCFDYLATWVESRAARATADSVLEDAARLEFAMQHGMPMERDGMYRYHGFVEAGWHPTKVAAIDAARKQGGKHD